MAQVVFSAGIDHVSGALSKPGKNPQHSCTKMLLATHRQAATTNPNCNRLYIRPKVVRSTKPSAVELAARNRFAQVAAMVAERAKDLNKQPADQAAFKNQTVYRTMKSYLWHVCGEEWDEKQG